jgi:hypothetical protein
MEKKGTIKAKRHALTEQRMALVGSALNRFPNSLGN